MSLVDNAFWIAALTGGTAVLASWVTTLGNARTARIQAGAAAETQRRSQVRDSRRAAYLSLIEQAHRMAELFWEVSATRQIGDADERLAARTELSVRQREEYAAIRRCVRVTDLEGPAEAAAAAETLKREVSSFHRVLQSMLDGEQGAEEAFDSRYRPFWTALTGFTDEARKALQEE